MQLLILWPPWCTTLAIYSRKLSAASRVWTPKNTIFLLYVYGFRLWYNIIHSRRFLLRAEFVKLLVLLWNIRASIKYSCTWVHLYFLRTELAGWYILCSNTIFDTTCILTTSDNMLLRSLNLMGKLSSCTTNVRSQGATDFSFELQHAG